MSKPLPATLVTRLELAEHFQVSLRTVSVWDKLRLIPRIKVGHVIRYDPKAVMAAISISSMHDAIFGSALLAFQDIQMAARKEIDAKQIEEDRILRSAIENTTEIAIGVQTNGQYGSSIATHPEFSFLQRLLVGLGNPKKIDGLMASIKGVVEASL